MKCTSSCNEGTRDVAGEDHREEPANPARNHVTGVRQLLVVSRGKSPATLHGVQSLVCTTWLPKTNFPSGKQAISCRAMLKGSHEALERTSLS